MPQHHEPFDPTKRVPKFLRHLYNILAHEDPSIIAWSLDGLSIKLHNVRRLEGEVLPKYFKHNKLASFQRQLNYFGFRKWTKTQACVCTFSHPHFTRDAVTPSHSDASENDNQAELRSPEWSTSMGDPLSETDDIEAALSPRDWDICLQVLSTPLALDWLSPVELHHVMLASDGKEALDPWSNNVLH
ncbi:hypothetical protein SPRG_03693 [Saprolegnia parasitica CBS 223.65]|uniref:HSF-type DNA-binding domain-containing protein n=1 Tax=Saprolegnia parasitica (strain CBS 223.65) TaxID=695850 RepID=A0A067CMR0_SAPPC|nr:hypothetical protein SPRG_03693 [Saprolegnia parasitica CBS 223.65]KDO31773.1 hypothetical protein SPRG_03693 [Saprolegnia parasitica CBS 223.65]|eukprot:XP_012197653.1 hypothetical protein SPRG_03693 [Saprolegnia parasitica CBS 223.65]